MKENSDYVMALERSERLTDPILINKRHKFGCFFVSHTVAEFLFSKEIP